MIDPKLNNRTVLVTGANTGIGREIALAFAEQKTNVVIHYLGSKPTIEDAQQLEIGFAGQKGAELLKNEIEQNGGKAICIEANLMNAAALPAIFEQAEAAFGGVDILVNNAAHCEMPDNIFESTAGSIDRHFQVNTRSAVLLIAELVKRKREKRQNGGRVINISTDAAQSFATQIAYGASKAAIEAFTRSIAYEVGHLGITVNTIAPGPVQTGWMSDDLIEKVIPYIPLQRVGTPRDIANAAIFLASKQAEWITGQVIKVAGGHNM